MNNLKKTFSLLTFLFSFSTIVFSLDMNGEVAVGQDTFLMGTAGNWPLPPHTPPFCYDLQAPEYGFGFGMVINLAGVPNPMVHPVMYATFTIEFDGLPAFVKNVEIESGSMESVGTYNGHEIYGIHPTYWDEFGAICPANMEAGNYTFELTTTFNGVHVPYPIDLYNGANDIFSVDVFGPGFFVETGTKYFCCEPIPPNKMVVNEMNIMANSLQNMSSLSDYNSNLKDGLLKLYPNPFSSELNVEFAFVPSGATTIELLNVTGQLLRREIMEANGNQQKYQLELNALKEGVYFIRINYGDEIMTRKILKTKGL